MIFFIVILFLVLYLKNAVISSQVLFQNMPIVSKSAGLNTQDVGSMDAISYSPAIMCYLLIIPNMALGENNKHNNQSPLKM